MKVRGLEIVGVFLLSLQLLACGGADNKQISASGGSGSSSSGSSGSGGSGSGPIVVTSPSGPVSSVSAPAMAAAANVLPVVIDNFDDSSNIMYVSVTICVPGSTTNCQIVDHVQIDTGSTGLRILAQALPSSFPSQLPSVRNAGGVAYGECMQYVDGNTWGPLRQADAYMGGEKLNSLTIQVIGDTSFTSGNTPASCLNSGAQVMENDISTFGAKGILGIANAKQDCGSACVATVYGLYYLCTNPALATSCQPTTIPLAQQLWNPVALLPADNNGTIISLPSVPASGAVQANGYLVFGIGTSSNNGLSASNVLPVTTQASTWNNQVTTAFKGASYTSSYVDSGTNLLVIPSTSGILTCNTGNFTYYCPAGATTVMAQMQNSLDPTQYANVSLLVQDVNQLGNSAHVLPGFAEPADSGGGSFVWGAPFFFGRQIYTALEASSPVPGTSIAPPFVAF